MSDSRFVVTTGRERHRTTATIDVSAYPTVRRIADRLAWLWFTAFSSNEGASSVRAYATTIRDVLGYLSGLSLPPAELRFVDELILDGWVDDMRGRVGRAVTRARSSNLRVLLANVDIDELHDSLTDGVEMRWRPVVERESVALSDLSPGQWAALRKFAKHEVLAVTHRIRNGRALAARGGHPGDDLEQWLVQENVFWLVLNHQMQVETFNRALRGCATTPEWLAPFAPVVSKARLAWFSVRCIRRLLLPSMLDMAAFWTAMAIATGLPPESVSDLEGSWFDTPPNGELTLLRYRKQRHGTPTLPLVLLARPQFSAQRLRDLYFELSAPLRPLAHPDDADRLWLYAAIDGTLRARLPGASTRHFPDWLRSVGLTDPKRVATVDEARTLAATRSTGRRTNAAGRRSRLEPWTGSTDPRRVRKTDKSRRLVMYGLAATANDHTVRVLIAHYTNSDLIRVRSAIVITDVADALAAFANGARPATIVPPDVAAELRADRDGRSRLAALLNIPKAKVVGLLAGDHDIGPIACTDPHASPHEQGAAFCRQAGTELCFTCPNGVVLAEHIPNLWAEIERLDRIAAATDGDTFRAHHGEFHDTLLDTLETFDKRAVTRYRARGVIPDHPDTVAPARVGRRRSRR